MVASARIIKPFTPIALMLNFEIMKDYIRLNTLKMNPEEYAEWTELKIGKTILPFVFELKEKVKIGKTIDYLAGLIHPQSLSSSIVPLALDPKPKEIVWDMTASPGSKTTEMAMLMKNEGVIVATDRKKRLRAIRANAERLGTFNIILKPWDAKKPLKLNYFDKVLLDAPCTALGSHKYAWKRFKPDIAKALSRVQKAMILAGFDSLKRGGSLVYSTCTITEEENEEVVEFLLENRNAEVEEIKLNIPHTKSRLKNAWRFNPEDLKSEAFFIAKLVKL